MNILDRFIKYVKVDTMSSEDTNTIPSTKKQFDLAYILEKELKELGLSDVYVNEYGMVFGTLPSNSNKKDYTIGFNAHLDTIPGFSGTNVKPNIINNYNGKDIKLSNGLVISNSQFPFLKDFVGKTLVTTDGTTVLGADDKAGIAIIINMLEYFVNNKDIEHTTIKVAFTPDEEIGGHMDIIDLEKFKCDFAYTVDGGKYNIINYECFNACSAKIHINGFDIHPGSAKDKMINASVIATEFESMLPPLDKPMYTSNYQGFNHLCYIKGEVGYCDMEYILRNHDEKLLEKQKELFISITNKLNKKYGDNVVELVLKDGYRNMANDILKNPIVINRIKERMNDIGINMEVEPIRGGTDGAVLTKRGLLTPNLGTGGYNYHGPYEFLVLEEMELASKIAIEIAKTKLNTTTLSGKEDNEKNVTNELSSNKKLHDKIINGKKSAIGERQRRLV